MQITIYTEDYFDAAHHLESYNGKCAERHGHTWQVCVWVRGDESQLADNGILWDFNNLKKVISAYDHTDLNEVCDFNPTAENICRHIYKVFKQDSPNLSFKVRLYEKSVMKHSYCELGDF
jgi:6-pyruvoyltetrahydropterin/6-carboxytetrahydropterin synthase